MTEHNSTEKFIAICVESQELFKIKNAQYGDAIWSTGVLGATVEIIGATARLPQLVLRDPTHGRTNKQNLIDIFKDLHNYAIIALMMLQANNWEGEK